MSAPDTNVEKQARRHRPALSGITLSLTVAGALFVGLIVWTFIQGETPNEATPAQIEAQGDSTQVLPEN